MSTAQAINGEIQSGDWVIVTSGEEYGYLIGQVREITPLGSPEHDTGNLTDDVHVNFMGVEYSEVRKADLLEAFDHLNPSAGSFDELPLDDVIMAPENLIRISGREISDVEYAIFEELLDSHETAEAYCNRVVGSLYDKKFSALTERLDTNLSDYHASLMGFGKREIIEMAAKIAAVSDTYDYLTTTFGFDDSNIDYLLKFQNPLEVVADEWALRQSDKSDMCFAVDEVFDKQNALQGDYALMSDAPARTDLRRFMGVDLIDFLGKIAEKTILHYPNDWNTDINALYDAAGSNNPEDKRLLWHVSSYGTHLNTERETFIKDTGAFNAWVNYRPNAPDMFGYVIEVTGRNGHVLTGNVFEVGDYAEHAKYVRETALPLDSVTLTYAGDWGVSEGKIITVSRFEYDNDRNRLMSESGKVTAIQYHPSESVMEMSALLQSERSKRMAYHIGSMETHVQRLAEKLAGIRNPPEQAASRSKQSLGEKLHAAGEKAKAQVSQKNVTSHKREERN